MNCIYYLLIFLLPCCGSKESLKNQSDHLRGIEVNRLFPILEYDSNTNKLALVRYDTMIAKIFAFKGKKLIQSELTVRKINRLNNQVNIEERKREYSILYDSSATKCAFILDNNVSNIQFLSKDSLLSKEWVFSIDKSSIFNENELKHVSTFIKSEEILEEKYFIKNIKDTTQNGILVLVFSKNNFDDLGFSLAKNIEEKQQKKIVGLSITNFARILPVSNTYIDTVVVPYRISIAESFEKSEILKLFSIPLTDK